MISLREWWLALAELPGQLAVEAEWKQRLGDNLAPFKPFIGPTDRHALGQPREDGRDGPMLRVVPGEPGEPAVVIDELTGTKHHVQDQRADPAPGQACGYGQGPPGRTAA